MIAVWAVYGPWLLPMTGVLGQADGAQGLALAALPAAFLGLLLTPALGDGATWAVGVPGTVGLIWFARNLLERSGLGLLLMAAAVAALGMYFSLALQA